MKRLCCAKGSGHGAQLSLTPVLSSRPSCLTLAWHHVRLQCPLLLCYHHHKAWLNVCPGHASLPPHTSSPSLFPTVCQHGLAAHERRQNDGDDAAQNNLSPLRVDPLLCCPIAVCSRRKTAKVHTLAWLQPLAFSQG